VLARQAHGGEFANFVVLPRMCCVWNQNKQRLFLFTALTYSLYNRGREYLLRGTDWVFKSDSYSFVLKRFISDLSAYMNISLQIQRGIII